MSRLSPASIRFLQRSQQLSPADKGYESYGQAYTQLFCELYDIMREMKVALEEQGLGLWTLTYDGDKLDRSLSFSFNLGQEFVKSTINLHLVFNPHGASSLSVSSDIAVDRINQEELKAFFRSPAYKRYFKPHSFQGKNLETHIAQRQIGSRHLGDYLKHLIEMAGPYIKCLREAAHRPALQLV